MKSGTAQTSNMDQAWYPHQLETEEEPEFPEEQTPEGKNHPLDSKSLPLENEPDQHGHQVGGQEQGEFQSDSETIVEEGTGSGTVSRQESPSPQLLDQV